MHNIVDIQVDCAWTTMPGAEVAHDTAYTERSSNTNAVSMQTTKLKRAHATPDVLEEDVVGVSPITESAVLLSADVNCTSREVPSVKVLQTRPWLLCLVGYSGILESFIAALWFGSCLNALSQALHAINTKD